ncbi:uncharacterized protein LOC111704928 [Eurytemora carolleeae]|uniref:uncharacterized protein LOC111704928 n=1 Tax=Eurytemora carolleeae TaxID=1294199 RepID=UPI000C789DBD|nr:uncharacterized protein LOC111704928 [Eurytemora carolleeae]XP_023333092.1 uncharacterized protein LOC111704928 [Eurytemora carolleeae]XP_023333093.1 uncharacterized protein LOC111704928 [Eurytemora carolleeae]|eukprot:XP_023333091.1 uncharacterized protein LOC111704928 [Eurytemora affinis]
MPDHEWRDTIKTTYNEWRHNDKHRSIKEYFNEVQNKEVGRAYKQDSNSIYPSLQELSEQMSEGEKDKSEKILKKTEDNKVQFLGADIEVSEEDEEAEEYARETIYGGFRHTMKKLLNMSYLSTKTIGDVMKKLLKKLIDFMEVGLQSGVIAIGFTIGHIVAQVHPIPDTELHPHLGIQCVQDLGFVNYGETVKNQPKLTFFPKTVEEIKSVIRYGRAEGRRVRCAGMKHSWSHMFSDDGEILVYLLPLSVTDTISFSRNGIHSMEKILKEWNSELSGIELVEELEDDHAAVRVGAATTNLEMLNWSNQSGWTLPVDIIAVMITYGGSNAMICHGAGLHSKTLSDLVLKIEFIDANGDYRSEDDAEKLKALGGCFGLAGIVTFVTLRLDKMTYARFQPKKSLMVDSIPKPGTDPSSQEFKHMVDLCSKYYVEFFWFPSHGEDSGYWENCWDNDGREEDAIDINLGLDDHYQITTTYLFEVIMKVLQPLTLMTREEHYDEKTSLQECLKYIFSKVVSLTGHQALPEPEEPATTSLVEALHFRRGFHYIAVREMEMEIPIPSLEDGSPDYSIVSKAWWDGVHLIQEYEKRGIFAVDMALELRIMGGSDILMASQFGNKHGTLAIEPVSTRIVDKEIWEDFKEDLARVWMGYKDWDGSKVLSRVHWAKESPRSVQIDDETFDTIKYWQRSDVYGTNMEKFFDILSGYNSVEDMYRMFSNKYLDVLFKPQWERFGIDVQSEYPAIKPPTNGVHKPEGTNGSFPGDEEKSTCCTIT